MASTLNLASRQWKRWLRVGVFVVMRGVNNMVAHCDQTLNGVDVGVPTSLDLRHRKELDY